MQKNWLTLTILSLLAGACLLQAEETVPKTAGVCFRFDDNKPPQYWQKMGALFEKYGYRMSLALVSQDLNSKESRETLQALAKKGHLMMDHLPNHAAYQISARNQKEFEEYAKLPVVDHTNPSTRRIYLKYELNASHPKNIKFQAAVRNGELCDYPDKMKGSLGFTRKILIPESGKVYGIRIQNGKKMLFSFWGEKTEIPDREKKELILLATNQAIQPPDAVLRFLAETSRKNFIAAGLPAPHTWIQPGGWECFVTPEKIQKIYGKEFGYISADCIPGVSSSTMEGFNEPNPELLRFNMRVDFTGFDNGQNLAAMKRNIAESIAKNRVKIFISHMWVQRVKGGWDAYINGYDELLKWLKDNKIPVKTQEEWAEILYSKKADPTTNIMPSLSTDRDTDGKPDGYELQRGTKVDLKNGIAVIPPGGKLHISDLAGLEKGINKFSLTAKGEKGATVILDFFFVMRNGKNYLERKQIRLNGEDWQTLSGTITVKPEAATLHFGVRSSGTKQAIEVKGPVLKP